MKIIKCIIFISFLLFFNSCSIAHYFDEKNFDDNNTNPTNPTNPTIPPFDSATMIAVSLTGNDTTGNGTASAPYRSLQRAVDEIIVNLRTGVKEIRVENGLYTPTNYGFNSILNTGISISSPTPPILFNFNGLKISGGFGSDFTALSGTTFLDGNNISGIRVIQITSISNLIIERFTIRGGNIPAGSGAGIYINGGGIITINCTITNNNASTGAGIYVINIASGGNITINGVVSGNTASYAGGGIFTFSNNSNLGTINITNVIINGNSAILDGGGIYLDTMNYINVNLSNSIITGNSTGSGDGAGIWIGSSSSTANTVNTINISNTTTIGSSTSPNIAGKNGGGIFIDRYSFYQNINATIQYNQANNLGTGDGGGGLYICGDNNQINSNISHNEATNGNGGGIYIANTGESNLIESVITNNTAPVGNGGGIYINSTENFSPNPTRISNSIISNNSGFNSGGIYINNCFNDLVISNNTITGNYRSFPSSTAYQLFFNNFNVTYDLEISGNIFSTVVVPGTNNYSVGFNGIVLTSIPNYIFVNNRFYNTPVNFTIIYFGNSQSLINQTDLNNNSLIGTIPVNCIGNQVF